MPCWKLVMRSLVCAADRGEAGAAEAPTPPGTRFAFGTRLGRPARVVPEDTGACATSAACHPSSAGEDQPAEPDTWLDTGAGQSEPSRPRRNQSDSTDSKMGSRFCSPGLAGGGTTTPGASPWPGAAPLLYGTPLLCGVPLPDRVPLPCGTPLTGAAAPSAPKPWPPSASGTGAVASAVGAAARSLPSGGMPGSVSASPVSG